MMASVEMHQNEQSRENGKTLPHVVVYIFPRWYTTLHRDEIVLDMN